MTAPSIFISYSHKDEIWKDRLRPHLGMLEKTAVLKFGTTAASMAARIGIPKFKKQWKMPKWRCV